MQAAIHPMISRTGSILWNDADEATSRERHMKTGVWRMCKDFLEITFFAVTGMWDSYLS